MSHSFNNCSSKKCFAQFKEPTVAGDYISKKNIKYSYWSFNSFNCCPTKTYLARFTPSNAGNYIKKKHINYSTCVPHKIKEFNKTQLYINLITQLQLNTDMQVITNNNTGISPTLIDPTENPNILYTIDPSGILFGNYICSINNWQNYLVYNEPINN